MTLDRRYTKNIGTIGEEGQRRLLDSRVVIIGAGGLGGTVFEIFVRYGVGQITIVDFDSFETTNLNRQLLSSEDNLGQNKAEVAAKRAASINSNAEVIAIPERITDENAKDILDGCNIACDCLGNIEDRFIVQRAARALKIPMVHAAIAGTRGQIMTIRDEGVGLEALYGEESAAPKSGIETTAGTPPSSVMTIASLQAHEAICLLLGRKSSLQGKVLYVDLADMNFRSFEIGN